MFTHEPPTNGERRLISLSEVPGKSLREKALALIAMQEPTTMEMAIESAKRLSKLPIPETKTTQTGSSTK